MRDTRLICSVFCLAVWRERPPTSPAADNYLKLFYSTSKLHSNRIYEAPRSTMINYITSQSYNAEFSNYFFAVCVKSVRGIYCPAILISDNVLRSNQGDYACLPRLIPTRAGFTGSINLILRPFPPLLERKGGTASSVLLLYYVVRRGIIFLRNTSI